MFCLNTRQLYYGSTWVDPGLSKGVLKFHCGKGGTLCDRLLSCSIRRGLHANVSTDAPVKILWESPMSFVVAKKRFSPRFWRPSCTTQALLPAISIVYSSIWRLAESRQVLPATSKIFEKAVENLNIRPCSIISNVMIVHCIKNSMIIILRLLPLGDLVLV